MAAESRTAIVAAIVGNFLIAVTKLVASALSGSAAMFAEAIHSFVDTGNGGLLLLGIHLSGKPADDRYPFGRGQELYFWTFVVAILIFGLGGGISIYEGIKHVLHPAELEDPTLNYVVLGIATVVEGVAWFIALKGFLAVKGEGSMWRAIRGSKDPTTFAVLLEDTAALSGLVVAFLGVYASHRLGIPELDGAASVVIGFILAGIAAVLAAETRSLLLGESAHSTVVEEVRRIAAGHSAVIEARRPLTMHMGPHDILVNLDLTFRQDLSAGEVARAVDEIESSIQAAHPGIIRIFIEAEAISGGTRREDGAPPG